MRWHLLDHGQFAGNGPEMAGVGKYYKMAKNFISQEPMIVQGRLTPQNVSKNRLPRVSDTNRDPTHIKNAPVCQKWPGNGPEMAGMSKYYNT